MKFIVLMLFLISGVYPPVRASSATSSYTNVISGWIVRGNKSAAIGAYNKFSNKLTAGQKSTLGGAFINKFYEDRPFSTTYCVENGLGKIDDALTDYADNYLDISLTDLLEAFSFNPKETGSLKGSLSLALQALTQVLPIVQAEDKTTVEEIVATTIITVESAGGILPSGFQIDLGEDATTGKW